MEDKLITVSTMLFILSMISERIVTFFKLWCVTGKSFFGIVPSEIDTSIKSDDPFEENKRQKAILSINLSISFLIAFISKASLFNMFAYTKGQDLTFLLGWNYKLFISIIKSKNSWEQLEPLFPQLLSIIIGCSLTACFISLGSKFWHDMLDMLFYVKNLKEKLVDKTTYEANNLKNLEQFLETNSYELAKICLDQNKILLDNLTNITNSFVGYSTKTSNSNPVIILNSKLQSGGTYPKILNAKLNYGQPFSVKTEIIYNYDIPSVHLGSGDNIYEQNNLNYNGTICCVVSKNTKKYLLTCAHVLTGGLTEVSNLNIDGWFLSPVKEDTFSNDNDNNTIGSWSYGLIDNLIDAALIEVDSELDPVTVNPVNKFEEHFEEQLQKKVFVNGDVNKSEGYVVGYQKDPIEFRYNGNIHKLKELIVLSENAVGYLKSITEGGDSGALVYLTEERKALGMVVGGNSQYTYVIPMKRILESTKTNLI